MECRSAATMAHSFTVFFRIFRHVLCGAQLSNLVIDRHWKCADPLDYVKHSETTNPTHPNVKRRCCVKCIDLGTHGASAKGSQNPQVDPLKPTKKRGKAKMPSLGRHRRN